MADTNELLQQIEALLRAQEGAGDIADRIKTTGDGLGDLIDKLNDIVEASTGLGDVSDKLSGMGANLKQVTGANLENATELSTAYEGIIGVLGDMASVTETINQGSDKYSKSLGSATDMIDTLADGVGDLGTMSDKAGADIEGIANMFGLSTKAGAGLADQAGGLVDMFGNFDDTLQLLTGSTGSMSKGMFKMVGGTEAVAGLLISLGMYFIEIWAAYTAAIFATVASLEKASAGIAKATSSGDRMTEQLYETRTELLYLGLGMDEAAGSIINLKNNFVGFNNVSKTTQIELAALGGALEYMGVAGAAYTNILHNMTLAQGKSEEAAISQIRRLGILGDGFRTGGMAQVIADFDAAMPKLAAFGNDMEDVFNRLSSIAEATNISVGTLMSLSGQMDTFSGAAEIAGQMNALLGMQLSTTEMLLADDAERLDILKAQFDATGRSFDQMSRYEQMSLAKAAGFQSVEEAQRFFNMSAQEVLKYRLEAKRAADDQEKFDELIKDAVPVMTRLGAALLTLFNVGILPLVEIFTDIVGGIADFFVYIDKEYPVVKKIIYGIVTAFMAIGAALVAIGITALLLGIVSGLGLITIATAEIWLVAVAVGAAVLAVVSAITAAFFSVIYLWEDWKEQLTETEGIFGKILFVMDKIGDILSGRVFVDAFSKWVMTFESVRNLVKEIRADFVEIANNPFSQGALAFGTGGVGGLVGMAATTAAREGTQALSSAASGHNTATTNAMTTNTVTNNNGGGVMDNLSNQITLNLDGRTLKTFVVDTVASATGVGGKG